MCVNCTLLAGVVICDCWRKLCGDAYGGSRRDVTTAGGLPGDSCGADAGAGGIRVGVVRAGWGSFHAGLRRWHFGASITRNGRNRL